jgi:hypothetical protein
MGVWDNSEEPPGPALVAARVQKVTGGVVDVSADILHPSADITVKVPGRQTELDQTDTGYAEFALGNDSGDYTPGYPSAPVMLQQDMPVVMTETVGRRTFPLFDGVIGQLDAVFNVGEPGDRVAVTAVDWPGAQQDNARTFISNLGEHILDAGGDALFEYWPMTEPARPFLPVKDPTSPAISSNVFGSSIMPADGDARITPAAGVMPLGEDSRIPVIGGPLNSAGLPAFTYHLGVTYLPAAFDNGAPPIASGDVLTVVVWIDPTEFAGSTQELLGADIFEQPSGVSTLLTVVKPSSGPIELSALLGSLTGTVVGSGMEFGRPYPIGVRWDFASSVMELWQGRKRFVGALSGSVPSSYRFLDCSSGSPSFQGSFGHLQLYIGDADGFTFADYLAQIEHAENALTGGLRWQRTDERIATVSRYAGLTDSQLQLDRGVAYMPRASLAGRTWTQVVQEAVDTEQGRLLWRDRQLHFDNRVNTKYNV